MEPTPTTDDDASIEKRTIQTDVVISEDRWQALDEKACRYAEHPQWNLSRGFMDARNECVALVPNLIVDGDVKGVEDLSCWSETDE